MTLDDTEWPNIRTKLHYTWHYACVFEVHCVDAKEAILQ